MSTTSSKPVINVTIAEIKTMLNQGKSRKEIAAHFNAPVSSINILFQHPDLKGLRSRRPSVIFNIVDDATTQDVVNTESTTEEVQEEAQQEVVVEEQTTVQDWSSPSQVN